MTTDDTLSISRRKILAGLGTVGVASGGAGLGTTAYLRDDESFDGNVVQGGRLDARAEWQQLLRGRNGLEHVSAYPDEYRNDPNDLDALQTDSPPIPHPDGVLDPIRSREEIAQDEYGLAYADLTAVQKAVVEDVYRDQFADADDPFVVAGPIIDLDDVKPGDEGEVTYSLHLFDEDAYVWLRATERENSEGVVTEPELDSPAEDDTGDGTSDGELPEALQVVLWYGEGRDRTGIESDPPDDTVIFEGTLAEFLTALADGIPLDGMPDTPGRDCLPQDQPGDERAYHVGFKWWLPAEETNELQGDRVVYDLTFAAVQCRHNDGVDNPFNETNSDATSPP